MSTNEQKFITDDLKIKKPKKAKKNLLAQYLIVLIFGVSIGLFAREIFPSKNCNIPTIKKTQSSLKGKSPSTKKNVLMKTRAKQRLIKKTA